MELNEGDVKKGAEIGDEIDRIMEEPINRLIETAIGGGLERWQVAMGFLFAAFYTLAEMEDWQKVETAKELVSMGKHMGERVIDKVFEDRRKSAESMEEAKRADKTND